MSEYLSAPPKKPNGKTTSISEIREFFGPNNVIGISVSGSIGAGKTWTINKILEYVIRVISLEDITQKEKEMSEYPFLFMYVFHVLIENPRDDVLKRYYTGLKPKKPYKGLETEVYFNAIRTKIQTAKWEINKHMDSVWLEDRPFCDSVVFIELQHNNKEFKMSDNVYAELMELYEFTMENVWIKPSFTIYLKCSPKKCFENVNKRNDDNGISLEYLEKLGIEYDKYESSRINDPGFVVFDVEESPTIDRILGLINGLIVDFILKHYSEKNTN